MNRKKQEYYFEIKTVKPNIDVFTASKKKMLDWVARKDKDIKSIVALPYNPYAPNPYARFTEQNLYDKNEEPGSEHQTTFKKLSKFPTESEIKKII